MGFNNNFLSLWVYLLLCLIVSPAYGEPKPVFAFKSGGVVWGFDFLDEKRLLVSRRGGELSLVDISNGFEESLAAPAARSRGQGGLLDVKISRHDGSTYFYATYSKKLADGPSTTALARSEFIEGEPLKWTDIFVSNAQASSVHHFGSRLLLVDDYLFMTIGDRGRKKFVQDLGYHHGKVLRLNLDGTPAEGNPFADMEGALPEIWTLGHRNPQGITIDQSNQRIYVSEFGPRGGDEVNLIVRGKNYGWPLITHGVNYSGTTIGPDKQEGLEQPLVHWVPSISPSGLAFVEEDGEKSLLLACLSSRQLRKVILQGDKVLNQEELIKGLQRRIRHVAVSPSGQVYFSTDQGELYRL